MEFNEVRSRLSRLNTAYIADADKRLRVISSAIRPIQSGVKLIGRAYTVNCHNDFLTVLRSIDDASAGDVVVIEAQGSRLAVAGELLAMEAKRKGLAGFVIDGAVRDAVAVRAMDFPVYAHSITPMSGTSRRIFHTQVPIECGGVTVHPGDIIFGDDDGLLVLSVEEAARVTPIAEGIKSTEEQVLARIKAGEKLHELLNFEEHWQKVVAGEKSELTFLLNED